MKYKIRKDGSDDFYRSRAWRRVRRRTLELYHYECQKCKQQGKLTKATTVHHDLPRDKFPEHALDIFLQDKTPQLIPLCFDCHETIEQERGNRGSQRIADLLTSEWW